MRREAAERLELEIAERCCSRAKYCWRLSREGPSMAKATALCHSVSGWNSGRTATESSGASEPVTSETLRDQYPWYVCSPTPTRPRLGQDAPWMVASSCARATG